MSEGYDLVYNLGDGLGIPAVRLEAGRRQGRLTAIDNWHRIRGDGAWITIQETPLRMYKEMGPIVFAPAFLGFDIKVYWCQYSSVSSPEKTRLLLNYSSPYKPAV